MHNSWHKTKRHGCGNSSCMHSELDLYIQPSNDLFICWLEWFSIDWAVRSIVVLPLLFLCHSFHRNIIRQVLSTNGLLRLRPGPKTFQWRHPLYLLGVGQSIVYHCISRRCSCHMVHDAGVGWWRILMTITHTSLV